MNRIPYHPPFPPELASVLIMAKNVEISNNKLAQFHEAICNQYGQVDECARIEDNVQ